MTKGDENRSAHEAAATIWRKALYILEALPPRRAREAAGGVLGQRKLAVHQLQVQTGNAFLKLAGSRPAAPAALTGFARRRAKGRGDAFSEASIRTQLVDDLQRAATAFGSAIGLPKGENHA